MVIDIPDEILKTNLTLGAKLIYGVAKENPSFENYLLAAKIGVSDKQLNRYILELDKVGLITRKRGQIKVVGVETWKQKNRKLEANLETLQSQIKIFKDGRFLGKK